jgi:phosphatidylglycerophosphate synthase
MAASPFGKAKTCLQIAAILAIIAVPGQPLWVSALLYTTVLVTVLSGLDYCFGLRRRMRQVQGRARSAELGRAEAGRAGGESA